MLRKVKSPPLHMLSWYLRNQCMTWSMVTTLFLPSCAFQKTVTKTVWVVRIRYRLSRPSSIVPGKFLDLSGTGHLVATAGAVLAMYKCPGVQGTCTPNGRQLMRCSRLNGYIIGLQIWTWVSEACLNPILDA